MCLPPVLFSLVRGFQPENWRLEHPLQFPAVNLHDAVPPAVPSSTTQAGIPTEGLESSHRLGLHVEQRGSIKRLVKELQDRLNTASADFQVASSLQVFLALAAAI